MAFPAAFQVGREAPADDDAATFGDHRVAKADVDRIDLRRVLGDDDGEELGMVRSGSENQLGDLHSCMQRADADARSRGPRNPSMPQPMVFKSAGQDLY